MSLNIVLFQPEIPQNTGNIARTCVLTNSRLHLIKPLGFSLDEKHLRRAGLDYWKYLDLTIYESYEELREKYKDSNFYFSTTHGNNFYTDVKYSDGDFIVFGRESSGLPDEIRDSDPSKCIRVPMINTTTRSLNLSNTVAIVTYEALRQVGFPDMKLEELGMEKIKIITDSTADLPRDIIEKYDIEVIPLFVSFGDKVYKDGIDIKLGQLFTKIEKENVFPQTSQVNPQRFYEHYKKYIDKGYSILSIHLSSKMSGTYQSACLAKDMLDSDNITIIDSNNVTSGLGLLVIKACKLRDEGLSIDEIVKGVKETIPHIKSVLAFETLDYLVKGGRLSKTAGFIGNVLGIKPILAVENGEMVVKDKVRGSKKAIRAIFEYINKLGLKQGEPCILLHVENKDILGTLRDHLNQDQTDFIECMVGCVVGIYAGPRACGIFFIEDY